MSGNVEAIRPGVEITEDVGREIMRFVEQKMAAVIEAGHSPRGIAFVIFAETENGLGTRTHWDLEHVEGPSSFAMTYAADRLKIEAHDLAEKD